MQTNINLSVYRPFPHPSCLVEHLQFINYKLNAAQTHLRVQHTINHSTSTSPHKIILHKSLDNKPQLYQYNTNHMMNNTRSIVDSRRNNALPIKHKINLGASNILVPNNQKDNLKQIKEPLKPKRIQIKRQLNTQKQNNDIRMQYKKKRSQQIDQEIRREIILRKQQKEKQKQKEQYLIKERELEKQEIIQKQRSKAIERQSKLKAQFEKQIQKLNDLIIRMRKEHTEEVDALHQELKKYQDQMESMQQSKIRTNDCKLKGQQLNNVLSEELEQLRSNYRNQRQKFNLQRKQMHFLKKRVLQLQSSQGDLNHEILKLQQLFQAECNINSKLETKNNQLQQYLKNSLIELQTLQTEIQNYKNILNPIHISSLHACEILIAISNTMDKLKSTQMSNDLMEIKYDLSSVRDDVMNTIEFLQSMYQNRVSNLNSVKKLPIPNKQVNKQTDKSINDSYKYLKTCADEQTFQLNDNSLYHMILCQAAGLEQKL